jgi:hypothetical protein
MSIRQRARERFGAEPVAGDELRALRKQFSRMHTFSEDGQYIGSTPPTRLDEAACATMAGMWITWRLDSVECSIIQRHRGADERPSLFIQWADDASIDRLHECTAAYERLTNAGTITYPSFVLEGELVVSRSDERQFIFVARQCLYQTTSSRCDEDAQTRMILARQMIDDEPLGQRAAPLRPHKGVLTFAYKRHQTPTQAKSVFIRPIPHEMADWPLLDGCELVSVTSEPHVCGVGARRYFTTEVVDDESMVARICDGVRRSSAAVLPSSATQ